MFHRTTIIGRLGGDPEIKTLNGGNQVCNASVAVTEKWKDKQGQQQEKTEWYRIVLWGPKAQVFQQYTQKGSLVYVEGKMQTRTWEDNNGVKKYATDLNVDNFNFLSGSANGDNNNNNGDNQSAFDSNEEIPF